MKSNNLPYRDVPENNEISQISAYHDLNDHFQTKAKNEKIKQNLMRIAIREKKEKIHNIASESIFIRISPPAPGVDTSPPAPGVDNSPPAPDVDKKVEIKEFIPI